MFHKVVYNLVDKPLVSRLLFRYTYSCNKKLFLIDQARSTFYLTCSWLCLVLFVVSFLSPREEHYVDRWYHPTQFSASPSYHSEPSDSSDGGTARASRRPRTTKKLYEKPAHTQPKNTTAAGLNNTAQQSATANNTAQGTTSHVQTHVLLITVGVAMCATLILIVLGQFALTWVHTTLDDLHYGRPRTFQTDAYVGHEQNSHLPSHFIALNNRGRIEIIEMPGNDATHARVFLGPQLTGSQANLVPVTLQFVDTHHDHHPEMLVQFEQTTLVFHNSQGSFNADYELMMSQ